VNSRQPNFNSIARLYRWLEYLTVGRSLERCRNHFLTQTPSSFEGRTRALVLGDGDGRFLARLMQQNPSLDADAVDTSSAMLHLLCQRCLSQSPTAALHLKTHHTDALSFLITSPPVTYDLVVTHFFLDCLSQSELIALTASVTPNLAPGALWLVSDFRIPSGPMRLPAKMLVSFLYFAFRMITGLRTNRLPDHIAALSTAGFNLQARRFSIFGILVTELWRQEKTAS
jgi:hypothetical protein